jgi:putative glutamine amidotransferase
VNSLHHQAASLIGSGLVVVATAEDGTVEALEGTDGRRIVAVQWHPELLAATSPANAALFDWLVAEAAEEITPAVV